MVGSQSTVNTHINININIDINYAWLIRHHLFCQSELVGSDFLMEIMELRETIDHTSEETELQQLQTHNLLQMEQIGKEFTIALDRDNLDEALRLTAMLQYCHRVDETIRDKRK